MDGTLVVEA